MLNLVRNTVAGGRKNMKLTKLLQLIHERLATHGDGEVSICVESSMYGQRVQIAGDLGELVGSVRYKGDEKIGVKYVLINKGFDDEH